MEHLEEIKKIIKQYFVPHGIFDCPSEDLSDERICIFEEGNVKIFICDEYEYLEVIGLSEEDFKDIENYYNELNRRLKQIQNYLKDVVALEILRYH